MPPRGSTARMTLLSCDGEPVPGEELPKKRKHVSRVPDVECLAPITLSDLCSRSASSFSIGSTFLLLNTQRENCEALEPQLLNQCLRKASVTEFFERYDRKGKYRERILEVFREHASKSRRQSTTSTSSISSTPTAVMQVQNGNTLPTPADIQPDNTLVAQASAVSVGVNEDNMMDILQQRAKVQWSFDSAPVSTNDQVYTCANGKRVQVCGLGEDERGTIVHITNQYLSLHRKDTAVTIAPEIKHGKPKGFNVTYNRKIKVR